MAYTDSWSGGNGTNSLAQWGTTPMFNNSGLKMPYDQLTTQNKMDPLTMNWKDLGNLGKFSMGMQGISSLAGLVTGIGQYNEMKKMNKFNRDSLTLDAKNKAIQINENNANRAMMANQMGGNSEYQKVSGVIQG